MQVAHFLLSETGKQHVFIALKKFMREMCEFSWRTSTSRFTVNINCEYSWNNYSFEEWLVNIKVTHILLHFRRKNKLAQNIENNKFILCFVTLICTRSSTVRWFQLNDTLANIIRNYLYINLLIGMPLIFWSITSFKTIIVVTAV